MATDGLGTNATRLLGVLAAERDDAKREARAPHHLVDRVLAERCRLHKRQIIIAADELLAAGYLALADAHGRWLGTLAEARVYRAGLHKRGRCVMVRMQHADAAIAKHESAANPDDRGQLALFPERSATI